MEPAKPTTESFSFEVLSSLKPDPEAPRRKIRANKWATREIEMDKKVTKRRKANKAARKARKNNK